MGDKCTMNETEGMNMHHSREASARIKVSRLVHILHNFQQKSGSL